MGTNQHDEGVDIQGPGGFSAKASGLWTPVMVLALAIVGSNLYGYFLITTHTTNIFQQLGKEIISNQEMVKDNQQEFKGEIITLVTSMGVALQNQEGFKQTAIELRLANQDLKDLMRQVLVANLMTEGQKAALYDAFDDQTKNKLRERMKQKAKEEAKQ